MSGRSSTMTACAETVPRSGSIRSNLAAVEPATIETSATERQLQMKDFTPDSYVFPNGWRRLVFHFALRGQGGVLAGQQAILPDLEGNFFAVLQTLLSVFFFGHARTNRQATGQFQFNTQENPKKIRSAQDGVITVLRDVRRDLHGIRAEAHPNLFAVAMAIRREFKLP